MNKTITSNFIKRFCSFVFLITISIVSKAQQGTQTITSIDTTVRKSNELILTDGTTTKKILINKSFDGQKESENEKKKTSEPQQAIAKPKND